MAKEYIEREAYYRQIDNLSKGKHGVYCAAINDCMNTLDEQPAADVVEVRHGEWIHTDRAMSWRGKDECSECHYHTADRIDLSYFNYCPSCGAKMDRK